MSTHNDAMRETWEASFAEQVARHAYNTAPVEALVRSVSYYLRDRHATVDDLERPALRRDGLRRRAEPGLARREGHPVSGVDIAPTALELARGNLEERGLGERVGQLSRARSATCRSSRTSRSTASSSRACSSTCRARTGSPRSARSTGSSSPAACSSATCSSRATRSSSSTRDEQLEDDPGTLVLEEGGSNIYLTNIGLSHFFTKDEVRELLPGWSVVDPCLSSTTSRVRGAEARLRAATSRAC